MAIQLDATSQSTESNTSSKTLSHTCSGSDRILFVAGYIRGNGIVPTGATYAGQNMTKIGSNLVVSTNYYDKIFLYYLINPPTGANNIVVNFSSSNYNCIAGVSYTGAKQSGVPDASTENGPTSTQTLTTNLTTIANNCWTLLVGISVNGSVVAGSGTTKRADFVNGAIFDSNGAISPAGSTSLSFSNTNTENKAAIMISFAPFDVSTNPAFLLNFV